MKKIIRNVLLTASLSVVLMTTYAQEKTIDPAYKLIAHRGGVVDSVTAENSIQALEKASERGYWMVEVDLRLTKDSVLITHHDRNFKRYYGVDRQVSSMTWDEISKLKGDKNNTVLKFEEVLKQIKENGLQVMVDNKIRGNDTVLFTQVVDLLKKYDLQKEALMIGTEESTPFFTGKVKLSCTIQQLKENAAKKGYSPNHYYLFSGDISQADYDWAKERKIQIVGVANEWGYRNQTNMMDIVKGKVQTLQNTGVRYFQIDSSFEWMFGE